MSKCSGWLPQGCWALNVTLFPLYFHMPSCYTNGHKLLLAKAVFLRSSRVNLSLHLFFFHFHLHQHLSFPFSFIIMLFFPSPPSSVYFTVSFLCNSSSTNCVSLMYACAQTDKSRPCWNACAADLVLIV